MLKILPQRFPLRRIFLQPIISYFLMTDQGQSQPKEVSFHEKFEDHMDRQFFPEDLPPSKSSQDMKNKELDILLSLSSEKGISTAHLGLNDIRHLLSYLAISKKEDVNLPAKKLHIAITNLQKLALDAMKNADIIDPSIVKFLFTLAQSNSLSLSEFTEMFHSLLNLPAVSRLSFENLAKILLVLMDLEKFLAFRQVTVQSQNLSPVISKLQSQIETLIANSQPYEYEYRYYLPKILFCFMQIDPMNHSFLNKLLLNISKCDLSSFEEIEITSLLYVIIKMEKKLHILTAETRRFLKSGLYELYIKLQQILNERISLNILPIKRVPHVLYCFAMMGTCSKSVVDGLIRLFITNIKKYNISEVCTVMYCLWRLPEIDPQNKHILEILTLYFDKSNVNFLSGTNLYTAFLGIRRPLKEITEENYKAKVENFVQDLLRVFKENFGTQSLDSKIRILYEITHTHKLIQRKEFLQDYSHFFLELDLALLNNHDLITVGFIMKKFLKTSQEQFEFWHRYLDCLSKRNWSSKIEENRTIIIFSNLRDLVANSVHQKDHQVKQEWIAEINYYYQVFMKKQRENQIKLQQSLKNQKHKNQNQ